jgi:1-phosphatidylinositol phosphodiesterase
MKKTKKHLGAKICIGIPAILLLIVLAVIVIPFTENPKNITVVGSESWMSELSDDVPLNEISLPGTHDSATEYSQLPFFAKCQNTGILQQLENGFRYLDIRLAVTDEGEKLGLMHGFIKCTDSGMLSEKLLLDSVLEDCYNFLEENPTECIVFAVKQEYGDESVSEFQTILNKYISEKPEYWYLENKIPSLGEARGKLILMRRYEDEAGLGDKAGAALLWDGQGGYDDTSKSFEEGTAGNLTLYVQDRYEYSKSEKWAAFNAETGANDNENVTINFLSTKGHMTFGHPYFFAKGLNEQLLESWKEGSDFKGWTIVDFGNAELAAAIYSSNLG